MRAHLTTDYGRLSGEQLGLKPGFRCSRCKGVKCPRHGGPPAKDRTGHGVREQQAQLHEDLAFERDLRWGAFLHPEKRVEAWRDEHGWHGYVGDPAITV